MDSSETPGEKARKLDENYARMLRAVLNKFLKQHPTKQPLTSHITTHPSKDEQLSDVLQ